MLAAVLRATIRTNLGCPEGRVLHDYFRRTNVKLPWVDLIARRFAYFLVEFLVRRVPKTIIRAVAMYTN